jgi:hypothetical protein
MADERQPFKRRSNGQFEQGGPGGPGRPPRPVEAAYLRTLSDRCPPETWAKIVDEAVQQAVLGDAAARSWLGKYLCGDARLEYSLTPDEKMIMLVGAI